jgi:hypothetical protein
MPTRARRLRPVLSAFGALVLLLATEGSARAAKLETVLAQPSFETAGLIVRLSGDNGNEAVSVDVKGPSDSDFRPAHPAARFEPGAAATTLFELTPGTDYSVRVTLTDPDGVTGAATQTVALHTRAAPTPPAPKRVRWVGASGRDAADAGASKADPFKSVGFALGNAQAGDEIRVLPGTYGAVEVTNKNGTADAPIVLRADDPNDKPIVDGAASGSALALDNTSYIVVDGFEIRNGGSDDDGIGVYLRASAHLTVRNCAIHDNGHYNVLVAKAGEYSGGVQQSGFHLLENNDVTDTHGTCSGPSYENCPGETYYGIKLDNNAGAGTVIRSNHVHGHADNMSPCGDEDVGRGLADGAAVLALVGSGKWTNHDLEIYDNLIEDARDDAIELDGICVNARVYRNRIKNAQNGISLAPALPGPYFVVRNVLGGTIGESMIKLNTNGQANVASRHLYLYHNDFTRASKGTILNLWFALPGEHNVPIHDLVFRNNVFSAPQGGQAINAYNKGAEQPSFDGDVWWTTDTSKAFTWWNGTKNDSYDTFAAFQTGATQEAKGYFGDPGLDANFLPTAGALVVDKGLVLPGINDRFVGAGPDVGAYELGGPKPGEPGGGPTDDAPGTGSSGGGAGAGGADGGTGGPGGSSGGVEPGNDDGADSGGCGCVVVGGRMPTGAAGAVAFGLLAAGLGRRRRRGR